MKTTAIQRSFLAFFGAALVAGQTLKRDPQGFIHLSIDGVKRSFDQFGNVIDARGLSPAEIYQDISTDRDRRDLEKMFFGIDGRTVTDPDQLYNPPHHLLPRYLTDPGLAARAMDELESRGLFHDSTDQMKCSDVICYSNEECKSGEANSDDELCGDCKGSARFMLRHCENKS